MTQCHDSYETDRVASARIPLLVRDVMTSPAVTIEPAATVKDIAGVLLGHDIRAVPVVDIGDVLVGVVSEADVICRSCHKARRHILEAMVDRLLGHDHGWADKAEGITAGEIMTREVIACTPTEPVAVAARRMLAQDVRILPVVENGRLTGVISRHDILRLFDRPDREVRARIAELLDSIWAPEGQHIAAEVLDGVALLSGSVRYPGDSQAVASFISGIPGVIEVKNNLVAERPEPRPSYFGESDS